MNLIIPNSNSYVQIPSFTVQNPNCQALAYNSSHFQVQIQEQISSCNQDQDYCYANLSQTLNCLQNLDYAKNINPSNYIEVFVTNSTQNGIFEKLDTSLILIPIVSYKAKYPVFTFLNSTSSISNIQINLPLVVQLELNSYLIQTGALITINIPQYALYFVQSSSNACNGANFSYQQYSTLDDELLDKSIKQLTINLQNPVQVQGSSNNRLVQFTLCNLQSSYIGKIYLNQQFTYNALPLNKNDASSTQYVVESDISVVDNNNSPLSTQAYNLVNIQQQRSVFQTGQYGNSIFSFIASTDLFIDKTILDIQIPQSTTLPSSNLICSINGISCQISQYNPSTQYFQIQIKQYIQRGLKVEITLQSIQNTRVATLYDSQIITIIQSYRQNNQNSIQATYKSPIFQVQISPATFKSSSLVATTDSQSTSRIINLNFVVTNIIYKSSDVILLDFTGSSIQVSSQTQLFYISSGNTQQLISTILTGQVLKFPSPQQLDPSSSAQLSFLITNTQDITSSQTQPRIQVSIQDSSNSLIQQDKILIQGGMIIERGASSSQAVGQISSYSFFISLTQDINCSSTTLQITLPTSCKYCPSIPSLPTHLNCQMINTNTNLQCSSSLQQQNQVISIQPCANNQSQLSAGNVLAISINLMNSYFIGKCDQSQSITAIFLQSSNTLLSLFYNASLLEPSTSGTFDTQIISSNNVVNAQSVQLTLTLNMNSILVDNTSSGGQIFITPSQSSPIPTSYLNQNCIATCLQPQSLTKQFETCQLQQSQYVLFFNGDTSLYCQTVQVQINLQYNPLSIRQATAFIIQVVSSFNLNNQIQEKSQVSYGAKTVGQLSNILLNPTSKIAKTPVDLNFSFKQSIQDNSFFTKEIIVYIGYQNEISSQLTNNQCQITTLDSKSYLQIKSTFGSTKISIQNCFTNRPYSIIYSNQSNNNNSFEIRTFLQETDGSQYEIDNGKVDGYDILPILFDQIQVNTVTDTVGLNPQLTTKLLFSNFNMDSYQIQINFPDYRFILSDNSIQPQYRISSSDNFKQVLLSTYYSQSSSQTQRIKQIIIQLSQNQFANTCINQNCQQNQLQIEISQLININALFNQQSQNQQNIQFSIIQNTDTYQKIYYQSSKSINQLTINSVNQFQVNVQPALVNQQIQFYYQLFLNPLVFSSTKRQLRFILPTNQLVGIDQNCSQVKDSGSVVNIPCSINSSQQLVMEPVEIQRNITLIYTSKSQTSTSFTNLSVFVDENIDSNFYPSFQSSQISFTLYSSNNNNCDQQSCLSCYDKSTCNQCKLPNLLLYQGTCLSTCPSGTIQNQSSCVPCGGNCNVCQNQSFCSQCNQGYVMSDGVCVLDCPLNTQKVEQQIGVFICQGLVCKIQNCKQCSSSSLICAACNEGYHLIYQNDGTVTCVQDSNTNCPESNMYFDNASKTCKYCNPQCLTCSGSSDQNCTQCSNLYGTPYLDTINNQCVSKCPDGTFTNQTTYTCLKCDKSCKTCSDATSCSICDDKYPYKFNNLCVAQCPQQTYLDKNICISCDKSCLTCSDSTSCLTCNPKYPNKWNNLCVSQCPQQTYEDKNQCINCDKSCQTCSDSTSCLTCHSKQPYKYNQLCIDKCPEQTFFNSEKICQNCDTSCKSCSNNNSCDQCSEQYPYQYGKLCVKDCPEKTYLNQSKCVSCHQSCETCTDSTSCSLCSSQYPYQLDRLCVKECDDTKYEIKNKKCELKADFLNQQESYNKTLVFTIISVILIIISIIAIFSLFSIHKSKVALIITLSSVFAVLENLTKLFMIIMSLDSFICILVLLTYSMNVIFGVSARNLFDKFEELGYEQWKQFSVQVKTKKYPKIYKFWYFFYFLGPQSIRISQSLFYQQDIDFYQKQSFKDQATKIIGQCYLFNVVQLVVDLISIATYTTSFDPFGLGIINICIYVISLLSFIREDPEVIKEFFRYLIRKYRILTLRLKG